MKDLFAGLVASGGASREGDASAVAQDDDDIAAADTGGAAEPSADSVILGAAPGLALGLGSPTGAQEAAIGRRPGGDRGATAGPPPPAHRGRRRGLLAQAAGVSDHIRCELASDRIYLVPLRAFMGVGWLRAFAEKAIEPGWRDGAAVSDFLQHQLEAGRVAFPVYRWLATEVLLPHAATLGWVVMVGELLAGLAILCGGFTSAALVGGLFMNLNFLLAGATEPSAFYIAIQALLLLTGAGAIVGVDAWLSRTVHHPLLVAQPVGRRRCPPRAPTARGVMLLALAVAGYGLAHVTDWSPGGSIHDPAVVLAVLASLGAGWSAVALLQAELAPLETAARPIRTPAAVADEPKRRLGDVD